MRPTSPPSSSPLWPEVSPSARQALETCAFSAGRRADMDAVLMAHKDSRKGRCHMTEERSQPTAPDAEERDDRPATSVILSRVLTLAAST